MKTCHAINMFVCQKCKMFWIYLRSMFRIWHFGYHFGYPKCFWDLWRFALPVSVLSCYNSNWAPSDFPVLSPSTPHDYIHCSDILKSFSSPFSKCQECVLVVYKCRDPMKKNTKPVMKEAIGCCKEPIHRWSTKRECFASIRRRSHCHSTFNTFYNPFLELFMQFMQMRMLYIHQNCCHFINLPLIISYNMVKDPCL